VEDLRDPATYPIPATTPLHSLLVSVAEKTTLGIESITQRNRRRNRTEVDLKVERHVGASVVVRLHRAADLVVSDLGIDLLPLPEDVVDHGVVHVE
jgi:hypothetical protein